MDVNLTEREMDFLTQYAKVYESEVNRHCTANPIVLVQVTEYFPTTCDYSFTYHFFDSSNQKSWETEEDFLESLKEDYELLDAQIADIIKELESNDVADLYGNRFQKIYVKKQYRTVAYFATIAEAERYCVYQKHNLKEPRVYTDCMGYSNHGDLPVFMNLMLKMGRQLNAR